LSQLIEEAIIFVYEDAMQGNSLEGKVQHKNSSLLKFLKMALEFMELCISKQFQEYLP